MATGRLPDPNSSPLTAKGDLYTYSTVPAKLAVGNNGETLVADSSTSTGLRYQPVKIVQPIINSCFDIWQRGTSLTGTGRVWTADRWWLYRNNGTSGATVSRQTSGLVGTQYCARIQRDSGNTSTDDIRLYQDIETNDSLRFSGQTVTVSFYARKGANYSGGNFILELNTGTGTDQSQWTGYTNQATVLSVTASSASMSTSTWTRYQGTITLATSVTQLGLKAYFNPTGTAGAADFIELSGVQIELGSVATALQRAGGTLAGELAACQRYYYRNDASTSSGTQFAAGWAYSTTAAAIMVPLPVTMRVRPTAVDYPTTGLKLADYVNADVSLSSSGVSINQANNQQVVLACTVASGLTQYRSYFLNAGGSSSNYVGFSAEL